ncbi:MAG: hypothetical protein ACI9CE_003776 [Flavobacterium sp.]|jgi:hypothetical protein
MAIRVLTSILLMITLIPSSIEIVSGIDKSDINIIVQSNSEGHPEHYIQSIGGKINASFSVVNAASVTLTPQQFQLVLNRPTLKILNTSTRFPISSQVAVNRPDFTRHSLTI